MPYNPGTQYRGDAYTFQGGQNAATAISGWLENFLNQQKQINAAGKAADSFVNAYQPAAKGATNPVLNAMGVHPDEWANLGAREKAARVHGYNQAKTLQDAGEEVTARINEHLARTKAVADEEARRVQESAGANEFLQSLPGSTTGTGTSGMDPQLAALFAKWNVKPPGQPQADGITQQLIAAAKKTAAANPAFSPELLKQLLPMLKQSGNKMPVATKVGGRDLIVNPESGSFQDVTQKLPALKLGEEIKVPGGGRFVGNGTDTPHFVPDQDRTKALTEQQANALQFAERMGYNNSIIQGLEQAGYHPAAVSTKLSNLGPNITNSTEFQQYDAAKKNWISAVLRKESGAAISKSEETGADAQYFPRMGDSIEVIKQKAGIRKLAEANMRRAIGDIADKSAPAASGAPARFDTEEAARSGGAKSGDVIELYDPATATYRKARLK